MSLQESARNLIRELNESAPYLSYAARFASFKGFRYDKKHIAACSSDALSHAGFYSTATKNNPTSAKCPFCTLELTFAENDDPWELHKAARPNCDYVVIGRPDDTTLSLRTIVSLALRCATVAKYEKMFMMFKVCEEYNPRIHSTAIRAQATAEAISLRDSTMLLTADHRLKTFDYTVRGFRKPTPSILKRLSKAGWCSAATNCSHLSVKCPFCFSAVTFSETDDFWEEHKRISPDCDFVKLDKPNEADWTADEGLMLAVRISVMNQYKTKQKILDQLEDDEEVEKLTEQLSRMMAKPRFLRRRCSV
ncbi:hypothetical protein B9Z55_016297 [Caenorhabditis nigoni]|uniref:Uncharacterized protein n=1 Tax=Caenorhabditis nigoni TaxID=1611254 RepID=A0A2G5T4J3_9PELO|nr:hypothetical protein B9Z55_016297 [Caenorhabditis nigoni]